MSPDYTFKAPGLLIEAWCTGDPDRLAFVGVLVEFGPEIPRASRGMVLESALRFWQRNIGQVRRGGRADLAGWRVYVFKKGRVARVRLSYADEESSEESG